MDSLVEFIKAYLIPGSVMFLLLGVTVGALGLFGRDRLRRWARAWLAALAVLYWLLSTPLVAGALEAALGREYGPLGSAAEAQGAQAVVVLGGGSATYRARGAEVDVPSASSALRALEGARVYAMLGDPVVFASGGEAEEADVDNPESAVVRAVLEGAGVPAERVILESDSTNTHEQAMELAPILRERGFERFVLVTSPVHMRRALGVFRAQGFHPVPSAALQRSETAPDFSSLFLPHPEALRLSAAALREALALAYYGARGWLIEEGG
jgi:uncharacterized SAM-binding protein YcdF (DUF218 family)